MTTNQWVLLIVVAGSAFIQGVGAFADSVWRLVVAGVALVAVFILFGVRLQGDGLTSGRARRCSRRRGE